MNLSDLLIDEECGDCIDSAEEESISTMHTPPENNQKQDSLKRELKMAPKATQAPQKRAWESLESLRI